MHCGFCLPVCPTYVRLGDENDSPRGRLYLMRAVVEGRLAPDSTAFQLHIDRCLGCRACEPVCPSGVPYGSLLELARSEAATARRPALATRVLLRVFASADVTRAFMGLARVLRATGLPRLAARLLRLLPDVAGLGQGRMALGMLAATSSWRGLARAPGRWDGGPGTAETPGPAEEGAAAAAEEAETVREEERAEERRPETVALLEGCVQAGLFARVNEATARVLEANGVEVLAAPHQECCGAIHAHGGDLETARELARRNIRAFEGSGADRMVVNAAGCGAILKEYGHLLSRDPGWAERAARFSSRVVDVSEALAELGPRPGAPVELRVAYDPPCHLLHAQGVADAPARVLDAVPGLERVPVESAEECCGGAGIYGLLHPELGGRIGSDKVEAVLGAGADVVATGNPGCIMQIGAGLTLRGAALRVVHPVEILDESYRRAGMYGDEP